ncbi:MAG: hypothetical protein M1549_04205 [Candidatus Dependentiae bacterium]|nr:hypothetical protein [Candidatus Dependentiae bacterium]
MRDLTPLWYAACALFLCANFGSQQSVDGDEKPPINYTGILCTRDGCTHEVKFITIGGLYKDIQVFGIPKEMSENPARNTTFINLDAVESIRPVSPNPLESIKKYNNRDYIELVITIKKAVNTPVEEQHFLVESTRRLRCDMISGAGASFKKEVAFEAISSISFGAIKARSGRVHEELKEKKKKEKRSAAKQALCMQAKQTLKEMEKSLGRNNAEKTRIQEVRKAVDCICGQNCK